LGSGIILATESFGVFLNVLLTLHEQVDFLDSCAISVERWVEFSGRSEGKVCCWPQFFSSY